MAAEFSPKAGILSMRAWKAELLAGGIRAGNGPTALSTSRQRPRWASWGCAQTSLMVLTPALAMLAASRRSTTCARDKDAKAVTIRTRKASLRSEEHTSELQS